MRKLRTMHLFAGAGGGILADLLLGHQPVCAVEIDEYCQQVLSARQEDGCFPWFPIFEDVQAFDGKPWRGIVDIVAGGFPCQDISVAGKGAGLDGERSGMWHHMARIIGEVRPRYVLVENSPALASRGLGRVLADLAALGFDACWGVLGASDVGAPHKRERIWIVANTRSGRRGEPGGWEMEQPGRAEAICAGDVADATCEQPHWSGPRAEQNWGTEFADDGCDVADANTRQCNGADGKICAGRLAPDCGRASLADTDSLRELQPQGGECNQWGRPCYGCGYVFDHERLGIYGCPNCEGEDVPDSDSDSVQGMEPESQQSGNRRQTGLHDRARSIQPWPADPADAPESGLGRSFDGMAQ